MSKLFIFLMAVVIFLMVPMARANSPVEAIAEAIVIAHDATAGTISAVASAGMNGIAEIANAGAIFSEDFTIDPEWISSEPDNVRWDPAGFYRAKVTDNPSGWAQWGYSSVFQEVLDSSFIIEFDINPVTPSYGTYPLLGLIEEGVSNAWSDHALFVAVEKADEFPKNFVLDGKHYGGSSPIYFSSKELTAGEWYHQQIDYDVGNNTLTWIILDSGGNLFHNEIYTGIFVAPFSQLAIGYQGNVPVYGRGWAEIYVDNIEVVPEPATFLLFAFGGLILRKYKVMHLK